MECLTPEDLVTAFKSVESALLVSMWAIDFVAFFTGIILGVVFSPDIAAWVHRKHKEKSNA
tara:strand:+ start:273 stop:455 length:183 start_codon:yes stop_codon:yes gene_type:complete